jgi:protein-S-isoprenylcysteine O-methyltransferase Ste14
MYTYIFEQISATMIPLTSFNNILVVVFVLCGLFYFFFSKAHTGFFNPISKIGIYTLMIGFGAGFGLTVMGRVALLVQRILFLKDYVLEVKAFIGG